MNRLIAIDSVKDKALRNSIDWDILKDYEYYWRLDSDSVLTRPISFDIFQDMDNHQYDYGYVRLDKDHPDVVKGLWETTALFIKENNINCNMPESPIMYYTNCELGRLDFFHGLYMQYYKYLDATGGIYTNRWGDAPIKYLGVNICNGKTHQYNIGYHHGTVKDSDQIFEYL